MVWQNLVTPNDDLVNPPLPIWASHDIWMATCDGIKCKFCITIGMGKYDFNQFKEKLCLIKSKYACFTGTYIVCKRSENWFFRFWCQLSPLALCFWRPKSLSYLHQLNDKTFLDMILTCFPRLIPKLCWKKQSSIFWTSPRLCSHSSGCWAEGLREQC